jgi:hypothetical protein
LRSPSWTPGDGPSHELPRFCNPPVHLGIEPAAGLVSGRYGEGVKWWKWVGLAGAAGVAATGVVIVRAERERRAYTPDEVRDRLHARLAETTDDSLDLAQNQDPSPSPSPSEHQHQHQQN